jgi:hypothetical protein
MNTPSFMIFNTLFRIVFYYVIRVFNFMLHTLCYIDVNILVIIVPVNIIFETGDLKKGLIFFVQYTRNFIICQIKLEL